MFRYLLLVFVFSISIPSVLFSQEKPSDGLFLISSYSTSIQDQEPNVRTNIFVACRQLNRYTLMPGGIFSFNDIVGEATEKNGYANGRVMYRDEVRYEIGGGLCQVSSTLYNALLLAGCTIVERHRHFRPVSYVPPGLDATIKYGQKNLKMKNTGSFPLIIETSMTGTSLTIAVKASSPSGFTYDLSTEEEDVEIPLGQDQSHIRSGINVLIYRRKLKGETVVQNQLLYRDYYPPVYDR